MFSRKKQTNPNDQIPDAVYEALQHGRSRYLWLYDVTVVGIIVVICVLGAILVYRLHIWR